MEVLTFNPAEDALMKLDILKDVVRLIALDENVLVSGSKRKNGIFLNELMDLIVKNEVQPAHSLREEMFKLVEVRREKSKKNEFLEIKLNKLLEQLPGLEQKIIAGKKRVSEHKRLSKY